MTADKFIYKAGPVLDGLSALIFGKHCISCRKPVYVFSKEKFCPECRKSIEFFDDCRFKSADGSLLIVTASYSGAWRKSLLNFKFSALKEPGYFHAERLAENIRKSADISKIDGIVFVPCYELKKGRFYNQSELLAKRISTVLDIPVYAYLKKKKNIKSQTACRTSSERAENADGVYGLTAEGRKNVSGKNFLLVDDIVTTGATLFNCKAALEEYGARSVISAVSAKTDMNYKKRRFTLTAGNSEEELFKLKKRWKKPKNFEKAARRRLESLSPFSFLGLR